MTRRDRYEAGVPCWLDLGSPDLAASRAFYGALFGWQAHVADEAHSGYTVFTLAGREVAGLGPVPGTEHGPAWVVCVSVDDADATAAAVVAAGGNVAMGPRDLADGGRLAAFHDAGGAWIQAWQPRRFVGARVTDEPGSFTWLELSTRDQDASADFYRRVFGWSCRTVPMGFGPYGVFSVGGTEVAGMTTMPPGVPDYAPPFWTPYFEVEDPDEVAGRCADLGGRVLQEAVDIEAGRFALVADQFGASFGIIRGADESVAAPTSSS